MEELTEQAQALMEQLEKLEEAASTEAISKTVEILDTDAGTIGDIDVLKQAIKDMDQLLEDFDGNLTEADKQTVQEVREQAEELLKKLEKKAAATTPATGDLLLPIAGAVCVLALVGMAVVLILKKKYAK